MSTIFLRAARLFFPLALLAVLIVACIPKGKPRGWVALFYTYGTNSSPQTADLTGDGILDVVIGSGKNLFEPSDSAVVAVDGENGHLLWSVAATDQMYGSATFLDVTGDGTPEVFIGGRKNTFFCINGKTGQLVWQYKVDKTAPEPLSLARYNFYNAQLLPDQNGDGLPDLLVSNGGNVNASPYREEVRYPGLLLVFNSKTGAILSAAAMPDGKETYMSPVVADTDNSGLLRIFFGTGGETIGGGLYRTTLPDLMRGDISGAKKLATTDGHGFFAPPVLLDINNDGVLDVAANSHNSSTFVIDGKTDQILWKADFPGTETSSSLAPGYFNADEVPDFFLFCAKGVWPDNMGTYQIALDGKTGAVLRKDSLGCTGFSSPVTCDVNSDGFDEVLLSINELPDCSAHNYSELQHWIAVFDIHRDSIWQLGVRSKLKNLSTTPWLGDLDHNGQLDLVYNVQLSTPGIISFNGMALGCLPTEFPATPGPTWGAYMGNRGDGIFVPRKPAQTH